MAKRNRKINRGTDGMTTKGGKPQRKGQSGRKSTFGRFAVLSIGGLSVVAIAVVAWTIFLHKTPDKPMTLAQNQAQRVPAANPKGDIPASGGPQISFPERSYNFGKITQGAKPSHTFVVKNSGDAPLKLVRAAGS
jgi:hypothetical protein